MKWLHRTIAGSRTYQLSWRPNETNRLDTRNFSHAVPRRLPAEVAYNALLQATARSEQLASLQLDPEQLATGSSARSKPTKANYALNVFGRQFIPTVIGIDLHAPRHGFRLTRSYRATR